MTGIIQLKREVEVINRTLNIDQAVPNWKMRSVVVQDLLKEWAKVPQEEKDQINGEVLEWYKGVVSQNI